MNDIFRVIIQFVELQNVFGSIKIFNYMFVEYALFFLLICYCHLLGCDEYFLQTSQQKTTDQFSVQENDTMSTEY